MKIRFWKKKERDLNYVAVYFVEGGEPKIYDKPSDCWESDSFLMIKYNGKLISYNLSYVRAYEFELKGEDKS